MAKDKRKIDVFGGEEVPDFVLTKEHRDWFKEYNKVLRIEKIINDGIKVELPKMQQLRLMFEQVQGKKQQLLKLAPPKPTKEIEGQAQGQVRLPQENQFEAQSAGVGG